MTDTIPVKTPITIDMPEQVRMSLTANEFESFAYTLAKGVEHRPMSWFDTVRFAARGTIASIVLHLPGSRDRSAQMLQLGHYIHPMRSHVERMVQKRKELRDTIDHGFAMVGRVHGQAGSLTGVHIAGKLSDGRTEYETTSITLPAFEGHGLNGILRETIVKYIEAIDPNPIFVTRSKNHRILSRCAEEGWFAEGYAAMNARHGIHMYPKEIEYAQQEGWNAYVYDPQKLGPLSEHLKEMNAQHHHEETYYPVFTMEQQRMFAGGALATIVLTIVAHTLSTKSVWFAARFGGEGSAPTVLAQSWPVALLGITALVAVLMVLYRKLRDLRD